MDILQASNAVGDQLADLLRFRQMAMNRPLLAASFVNLNDLTESCTLGRIMSEQIKTRLVQHGFSFIELKLRQESVFIKETAGEFVLSRELRDIATVRDIYAVLAGAYVISEDSVFVSARVILTEDSRIIAGQECELSRHAIAESLLK